jgi:ketosteroid isomerase-like protein
MKSVLICITMSLVLSFSTSAFTQVEALASPQQTIASLFKSMYDGDGELAKSVFADDAILHSVYTKKDGEQVIRKEEVEKFIEAISNPREEVWDERISNLSVKIDGDLAQAWMDYSFYLEDEFSHCGVNAMHLVRKDGKWKIFQIVDTRRKSDCN